MFPAECPPTGTQYYFPHTCIRIPMIFVSFQLYFAFTFCIYILQRAVFDLLVDTLQWECLLWYEQVQFLQWLFYCLYYPFDLLLVLYLCNAFYLGFTCSFLSLIKPGRCLLMKDWQQEITTPSGCPFFAQDVARIWTCPWGNPSLPKADVMSSHHNGSDLYYAWFNIFNLLVSNASSSLFTFPCIGHISTFLNFRVFCYREMLLHQASILEKVIY